LSGRVVDYVYRGITDVRVEVVGGSGIGVVAMTNASGDYALPGVFSGPVTVQASKAGYVSQTLTFDVHPQDNTGRYTLGFILDTPSENLSGDYTVTITADPACSELPPETRRRTYAATATPSTGMPNTYNVVLSGASFSPSYDRMFAVVSGDAVMFSIDPYSGMVVTEQLTPTTALAVSGFSSVGAIGGRSISGSFGGQIDYCPDVLGPQATFPYFRCGTPVHCASSGHTLTVTRR
jgi:Carboxypeptidase regulatory-like domain